MRFGVDLSGMLTWVGDLASWFVEWNVRRRTDPGVDLIALAATKVDKDDLLGDMDGQVLAHEQTTMRSYVAPTGGGMAMPITVVSPDAPLSALLRAYYGEAASAASGDGNRSNRFHHFVARATPRIPHRVTRASPLQVALDERAQGTVAAAVREQARFFIDHSYQQDGPHAGDVDDHAERIDEIARRFLTFLATGLATGDAPWP